jgi:phosphate transport system substrate-binding protein
LFQSWLLAFHREHPTVQPVYQGISSARGVADLEGGRIDFAGADYQVSEERAAKIRGGILQLPMTAAAIALIYNLPEVETLALSRKALIGIFTGKIARWNDPMIAEANPGLTLPDLPITLVTRTGAAGTSYNLTRHLSTISPEFESMVGTSLKPNWPTEIQQRGTLVSGKGNDGVAALVKGIAGAIGYVAYPYASLAHIPAAAVENKAGNTIAPDGVSFVASIEAIAGNPNLGALLDPPGDSSYPMIAVSWMLMPRTFDDPAKQKAMVEIIDYALGPGQDVAERIGYIPFSPGAIAFVRKQLEALKTP